MRLSFPLQKWGGGSQKHGPGKNLLHSGCQRTLDTEVSLRCSSKGAAQKKRMGSNGLRET